MTVALPVRQAFSVAVLLVASLALSACFLLPGKFASRVDLAEDGQFTFTYNGDLHFVTPSESSSETEATSEVSVFEPQPCYTSNGEERECSAAELDQQMKEWEEQEKQYGQMQQVQAAQMAAVMGATDISDPKVAEEIAEKMRQQAGWKKVEYLGKGRFAVEVEISGTLDHTFVFPVIEDVPLSSPFVVMTRRKDDTVRIDTPAFSAANNPYSAIMQMAEMEGATVRKSGNAPEIPVLDGSFTITTRGTVLANNTDNGPTQGAGGTRMEWSVNARSGSAPTALVKLAP